MNGFDWVKALFNKPQPLSVPTEVPKPVSNTKRAAIGGVASAAVISAALAFIAPWEGIRYHAYLDVAGVPTICRGHTKGVRMGDTATAEQCEKWFREEVTEFDREIRKCLTLQPTANEEIAFLDLAYNIGVPAFCRSSALAKFNAGEPDAACGLLTLYDKVRIDGHLRVNGWQVRRRNAEAALCRAA